MKSNANTIEKIKKQLERKRTQLEEGYLNAVRELLPNEIIEQLSHDHGYFFRKRLFTPIIILFHMIGAAINREGSFQSSWHCAGQTGSSYQLAKGRKRLPLCVLQAIAAWIVQQITVSFTKEQQWHGHRVIVTDGTCISMSDTKALAEKFGKPGSNQNASKFPVARIVFAATLKTFIIIEHAIGSYMTSEKELFLQLLKKLLPGDLLVADCGFAGAALYSHYLYAGLAFITRMHNSLIVSRLKIITTISSTDLIVELPIAWEYRKKDPTMPETIFVRIIKTKKTVKGKTESFWLVTSLLNPKKYSASSIIALYMRRWKVETLIEQIKVWLGADVLRSHTVEGICKELSARIIACNLLHWLMLKSAKKHKTSIDIISFSATIRLVATYSARMSEARSERLPFLYKTLLEKIASARIPYRPGRIEPRAKKRNAKPYPNLKISRSEWRIANGFAA